MTQSDSLNHLAEIRKLMENSSRFISLSGLAGIFAGSFALIGAIAAYFYLNIGVFDNIYSSGILYHGLSPAEYYTFFFITAGSVFLLSLLSAYYFTQRKAKKFGLKTWDNVAKRMIINLFLPLAAGGIFCLILLKHGQIWLIAPATLLFYGMALLNAGKYTLRDIRYLGISEIALGLLATWFYGYGLLFWALGFGVLHIIYGTTMYFKYEYKK